MHAIVPPTGHAGTVDLPDVPPSVQSLLLQCRAPILAWVETLLLQDVLAASARHPLVQINAALDLTPVVTACAGFHQPHPSGKGRPPTYTIETLVRAEIVRAWLGACSDPELEWQVRTNLLLRWFIGLPLCGPTPDHSTFNRFHAWVTTHQPAALFRTVLAFLDQVDPEDAHVPQIVDTVAMQTPAALTPTVTILLRAVCADLVAAWQRHAPGHLQRVLPARDWPAVLHPPRPRDAAARQTQLTAAVTLAQELIAALTPHLAALPAVGRAAVQARLAALPKIIADELMLAEDAPPQERRTNAKGSYRIISATDLEATFRKHDDDLTLGWNVAVSTTTTRIRAVVVATGATPDSEIPVRVLRQQIDAGAGLPTDLIMDRAGGWGKVRATVAAVSNGQTQMVALAPTAGGADPTRFGPTDFRLSADRTTCTCPNDVTTTRLFTQSGEDGIYARFLASQCEGCPLYKKCRAPTSKPTSHRSVFFSHYQSTLQAGLRRNATPTGQRLLGMRWRVEPTLSWVVRYEGCRRARRVGQAAAQAQWFQACAIRNLLRWLGRVARGTATRPPALERR